MYVRYFAKKSLRVDREYSRVLRKAVVTNARELHSNRVISTRGCAVREFEVRKRLRDITLPIDRELCARKVRDQRD